MVEDAMVVVAIVVVPDTVKLVEIVAAPVTPRVPVSPKVEPSKVRLAESIKRPPVVRYGTRPEVRLETVSWVVVALVVVALVKTAVLGVVKPIIVPSIVPPLISMVVTDPRLDHVAPLAVGVPVKVGEVNIVALDSLVTLPRPTSVAVTVLQLGTAPLTPVPVILKKFLVAVVFGDRSVVVSVFDWYGIEPRSVVLLPPTRLVALPVMSEAAVPVRPVPAPEMVPAFKVVMVEDAMVVVAKVLVPVKVAAAAETVPVNVGEVNIVALDSLVTLPRLRRVLIVL
jgi:hypothetical protein